MEWSDRWIADLVQPEGFAAGVTCGIAISIGYQRLACFRCKPASCLDRLDIDVVFLTGPYVNGPCYFPDLRSADTGFKII
jgi:hypothetical protein